jgi:hypothetical protein
MGDKKTKKSTATKETNVFYKDYRNKKINLKEYKILSLLWNGQSLDVALNATKTTPTDFFNFVQNNIYFKNSIKLIKLVKNASLQDKVINAALQGNIAMLKFADSALKTNWIENLDNMLQSETKEEINLNFDFKLVKKD